MFRTPWVQNWEQPDRNRIESTEIPAGLQGITEVWPGPVDDVIHITGHYWAEIVATTYLGPSSRDLERLQAVLDDFRGHGTTSGRVCASHQERQPLNVSEWQTATTCLNPKNATWWLCQQLGSERDFGQMTAVPLPKQRNVNSRRRG